MKLRVFESISVDGYFTDREGDIAWVHSGRDDPEFGTWVGANANLGGILLFGRVTYEMMEAFWPTPAATVLRLLEQRVFRCGNVVLTYATSHS